MTDTDANLATTPFDTDLSLDRIAEAATVIDPAFLNSPQYYDEQLCDRLGRRVLTKVETLNPLRSFKGRGADFLVSRVAAPGRTIVCGSGGGNFGQAIAYAATRRGLRAEVFMAAGASPVKVRRAQALGAHVRQVEGSPKEHARAYAAGDPQRIFVEDGRDAAISEGAGTIGVELLRGGAQFDTVVLPVGDGALITGVALWIKTHAPQVRVIGATAAAAPALARSWRAGEVMAVPPRNAFAAGISIAEPVPEAVARTRALVDEMVAVEDEELLAAMRLAAETLGVMPEPAGAAGLAVLARGEVPGGPAATVLTGANADPALFAGMWAGQEA
ncbi:pyridoxal-phosphate dependent enzyme [Streptomyces sp. A7024]|uniref:Pyridoxal-phosphate dependent enzyme n=1 Tax=Streptomyces coryli TaxID=1128680 RepID=A0A6G4U6Z1_9ACTN|nr:pyridoxal-phosphate dependent enzyme [Streptomyces coryli]NGN67873.1 pyridoxal-phosphate dependent enzyme [Streptomyces coryli]